MKVGSFSQLAWSPPLLPMTWILLEISLAKWNSGAIWKKYVIYVIDLKLDICIKNKMPSNCPRAILDMQFVTFSQIALGQLGNCIGAICLKYPCFFSPWVVSWDNSSLQLRHLREAFKNIQNIGGRGQSVLIKTGRWQL